MQMVACLAKFFLLLLNGLRSPVVEEPQHPFFAIAFPFLQKTGVLNVKYLAIGVEHHKNGKTKTGRIAQSVHQRSRIVGSGRAAFARIIIDVYKFKVVVHRLVNHRIILNKIGKAQTPRAPVAAHLAHNVFVGSFSLDKCIVYLRHGVDGLVIHPFQCFCA